MTPEEIARLIDEDLDGPCPRHPGQTHRDCPHPDGNGKCVCPAAGPCPKHPGQTHADCPHPDGHGKCVCT